MFITDYVSMQATIFFMEHHEANRCVSWATTVYQYASLAVPDIRISEGIEIETLPEGLEEILDYNREVLETIDLGEWPPSGPGETSTEIGGPEVERQIAEMQKLQEQQEKPGGPDGPDDLDGPNGPGGPRGPGETSTEIGGPEVEKEIEEIRKLQEEHERAQAEQEAKLDEKRDQMAEKYEGSPDQERIMRQFEEAARAAAEALARQQAAELQRLQEMQMQQMQAQQRAR